MTSLGFAGLGMMGNAMARRLLKQGFNVTVWNRSPEKCRALGAAGATIADSLEELARSQTIILSMLSTSEVVSEVAGTIRRSGQTNAIHVDLSTISPRTAEECEREARALGRRFVHAPVLGSVPQVEEGSLLIFAGGDAGVPDRVDPVLSALGRRTYRFDRAADASHLKLACNFFIASMITTLGQGLSFASQAGLDASVLLDVLGSSALGAPMYATKGRNILAGNFEPRFFLGHMLKDVRLFREAAERLGVRVPFGGTLEELFEAASRAGLDTEDYSSVVRIL